MTAGPTATAGWTAVGGLGLTFLPRTDELVHVVSLLLVVETTRRNLDPWLSTARPDVTDWTQGV
jgi:hypothetical protein